MTLSKRPGLVWKGPEEDGITFSMLSRFLVCRERFRVLVIERLKPADTFNHKIEFGQMWHICEQYATNWGPPLKEYVNTLCQKYPTALQQIEHWYNVCLTQYPIYVRYKVNNIPITMVSIAQEKTFNINYKLPSRREVKLRGKFDAVNKIGNQIYLQENKTKGQIIVEQVQRQLSFDLQTMLYLVAMEQIYNKEKIGGVIYNVVRRPLSGGKGSIVRHKATKNQPEESYESFYSRLGNIIESFPQEYFACWKVEITNSDIDRFKHECLNPLLESLCQWWDGVSMGDPFAPNNNHWRHPYGVYNILDEGGSSDLDEYLATGSTIGLERIEKFFTELDE